MIKILTGDKRWTWDDENDNDLNPSGNFTKNEFKKLLNDFRSDTPEDFKEIFKTCVQFDPDNREIFAWVSYYLNFLHLIFKVNNISYYQVTTLKKF